MMVLAVDFGTSNTVAVLRTPDGRRRPLLFDGSPLLPSAVYLDTDGRMLVGRDAVRSASLDPSRFEPNPKRRIDDGMVLLGDRELPVGELLAAVLRRVRDEWRHTVGDVLPDVTLTFPASWGATRRLVLADAAAAAGFGRVRLVPEPVAAAAYFTHVLGRDVPIGSVVVVHDFGAGTFDASVVARTSSGFEVLAVDGRDDIGGIDVDDAIVAHIGRVCEVRDPVAWQRLVWPTTVKERRARQLLWDDAKAAKERLSRSPAAALTVPLLNVDVHLTREEFEDLARPLLEQTVRVTQGVIRWAQQAEDRVAGVFLVGGSSRIPLAATLLHRAFEPTPTTVEQPELVVAEGTLCIEGPWTSAHPASPAPMSGLPASPSPVSPPPPVTQGRPVLRPPGSEPSQVNAPGPSGLRRLLQRLRRRPRDAGRTPADAPPEQQKLSLVPGRTSERHVNTDIVESTTMRPVASALQLAHRYLLAVDIGLLRQTEVVNVWPESFPVGRLPPSDEGWWLDVVLSSPAVTCEALPQPLFLPPTGPAFCCPCRPHTAHHCGAGQRTDRLYLPFVTRSVGAALLQLTIYHGAAAVQVLRITMSVGTGAARPTSEVVFSISRDFTTIGRYADRSMSIVSSGPTPGRHQLLVNDGHGTCVEFDLVEQQAATAARELRRRLFDVHLEPGPSRTWRSRYDRELGKAEPEFIRDLHQIAVAGREAYLALFPDVRARRHLRQRLADDADVRGRPPTIQIALAANNRVAVPWQLLYELPVSSTLAEVTICPSVQDRGETSGAPLVSCPYETRGGHDGDGGVVCPYGFWGLSYVLEVPPWSVPAELADRTGTQPPASVLAAVNGTVAGAGWPAHHQVLAGICGPIGVLVAADSRALRHGVRDGVDVLYFLCHGVRLPRAANGADKPALELRPGEHITPQDVADWADLTPPVQWHTRRPLVVLNGCHTGELLPDTLTEFVTAFVGSLGAAGVLATEIALDRDLACHAVELLLARLWAGEGVGMALWRMRWELLHRRNMMGLAYSPYCDASLRIPRDNQIPRDGEVTAWHTATP